MKSKLSKTCSKEYIEHCIRVYERRIKSRAIEINNYKLKLAETESQQALDIIELSNFK